MIIVVHYLNQFFGQIGSEEKADISPQVVPNAVGPGLALQKSLGERAKIVTTVICGDTYFADHTEKATAEVVDLISPFKPQLVVAGPAFNAGRYGPACGAICKAVQEKLGVPAVTGMYPENPGVELYRKHIYCVKTGSSAADMQKVLPIMAALGLKLALGEKLGPPEVEGYLPRGLRKNAMAEKPAATRAMEMFLAKLKGLPYRTELPMPTFEKVPPAPPVDDLLKATIALVIEGGLVPKGNPDRLESARASKYVKYSIAGKDDLSGEDYQSVHGGFTTVFINQDPDRVLPLDAAREAEREGKIGKLHPFYFTTTGNQCTLENAKKFGQGIAKELIEAGVQGVILTST